MVPEKPEVGCTDIMSSCPYLEGEGREGRTLTMWDLSEAKSRMNTSPGTILNKLPLFHIDFTPVMNRMDEEKKKEAHNFGRGGGGVPDDVSCSPMILCV